MTAVWIDIERIHEKARLPQAQTPLAACLDLHAVDSVTVRKGEVAEVHTGLKMAIPTGWEGQLRARSGLARKNGITLVNAVGTIDSDYRDEVIILLTTYKDEPYIINSGDRVAQIAFRQIPVVYLKEVNELSKTERSGGFGSTGV